ncbi:MAG: DUF72 domain-containing protein [Candidatus Bathyarchaeia archaeon]
MEFYVGTSGWAYPWNEGRNLGWYVANSGLNAIELNASFYRYPYSSMIKSWSLNGNSLRWVIKVNRLITHIHRFSTETLQQFQRFRSLFAPIETITDFFLFQTPASLAPEDADKIETFFKKTELETKFALEVRNLNWFTDKWAEWATKVGITLVSVDAPTLPRKIFKTTNVVYMRMHGRTAWYRHDYSVEELKEVVEGIRKLKPEKAYIFFNNNHAMLENARQLFNIIREAGNTEQVLG